MVERNRSHENEERKTLLVEKKRGKATNGYTARILKVLLVLKFCFDAVRHYSGKLIPIVLELHFFPIIYCG